MKIPGSYSAWFSIISFFLIPSLLFSQTGVYSDGEGANKIIIKGRVTFNNKPLSEVKIVLTSVCFFSKRLESKVDPGLGKYKLSISTRLTYSCLAKEYDETSATKVIYYLNFKKEGYKEKCVKVLSYIPYIFQKKGIRWNGDGFSDKDGPLQYLCDVNISMELEDSIRGSVDTVGLIVWDDKKNRFVFQSGATFNEKGSLSNKSLLKDEEIKRFSSLFFETNKSSLTSSLDELNKLADFLVKNKDYILDIAGHSDNTGSEISNKKISEARSRTVAEYLISKGVDKSQISYKGYGSSKPIANNGTAEGRRINRRVEFVIRRKF